MIVKIWTGKVGELVMKQVSNVDSIDFVDFDHIIMYRKNDEGILESIGTVYYEYLISIDENEVLK